MGSVSLCLAQLPLPDTPFMVKPSSSWCRILIQHFPPTPSHTISSEDPDFWPGESHIWAVERLKPEEDKLRTFMMSSILPSEINLSLLLERALWICHGFLCVVFCFVFPFLSSSLRVFFTHTSLKNLGFFSLSKDLPSPPPSY